jgi:hypothetical protein
MMGADRDRAMRLQGAARVLGVLARHYHQADVASAIMETLGITLHDLEQVCELDPITFAEQAAHSVDRLIVTRGAVEKLRVALAGQGGPPAGRGVKSKRPRSW